jgi:hypothetical protein
LHLQSAADPADIRARRRAGIVPITASPLPARESPMHTRIRKAWKAVFTQVFDKEGLDAIFLHARNVLTGAAVVAAGLYAVHHVGDGNLRGMWKVHIAGYAVAFVGAGLLLLNLFDGLRKLARARHHVLLRVATIVVYVAISMRLTQVIIYFRAAS